MTDIMVWPRAVLRPATCKPNMVPFTRSGGTSTGGIERVVKTDRGFWDIVYENLTVNTPEKRRLFNIIRQHCGGRVGTLAIPVWSYDSAPWAPGTVGGKYLTTHSDDTEFSDGSTYSQPGILVELAEAVTLGQTFIKLQPIANIEDISGVRFSVNHALYETGAASDITDNVWTMPLFPAAREPIALDTYLEFDMPTCLVRLATDREMDISFNVGKNDNVNIHFKEDTEEWNRRALL